MKPQRPAFLPVSSDLDEKLESLARDKGVGALVKPTANQAKAEEGPIIPHPAPSKAVASEVSQSGATPRSRMKTVNLELPDYVWTELKIRAAHKQTSVRHIVMTALKGEGITIHELDMIEDGRRLRGGPS